MFQLSIGVGWSVVKLLLGRATPEYIVWTRIGAHKVLWNKDLYAAYISDSRGDIDTEIIEQAVAAFAPYFERIEGGSIGISHALSNYFRKKRKDECVIIAEEEDQIECSKNSCCNQYSIERAIHDNIGVLAQYEPGFQTVLSQDDAGDWYLNWVRNIISNEDEVNFIDPYLLKNENGIRMLKEHYMEMLKPGARINLHISEDECSSQTLKQVYDYCDENFHQVNIYLYKSQNMHDRYITTHDMVVSVGIGLDVLNRNKRIRKQTQIHYYQKKEKYLNSKLRYEQEVLIGSEGTVFIRE